VAVKQSIGHLKTYACQHHPPLHSTQHPQEPAKVTINKLKCEQVNSEISRKYKSFCHFNMEPDQGSSGKLKNASLVGLAEQII